MPRTCPLALLLTLLLPGAAGGQGGSAAPIVEIDRIVAVVNNDVIVESELRARLREVRAQLRQAGARAPEENALTRQVLERLILDKLQLQIALENGLRVEDGDLSSALENIASSNNLTLRQFRDVLERDGFDFGRFREQVRNEILLTRVRQRSVERRVRVTPREIDNFLATARQQGGEVNEYRLGHILIAVPEAASADDIDAARVRVEEVAKRLRDGEDFAQLAAEVSDGQQALQGGDLGWRKSAELPTIFTDAVVNLQPGELSSPIRSPSGFHLVKLEDLRGDSRYVVTQIQARHILVRPNDVISEADAQVRLTQLRTRLENGEDFAELARSHSDDTVSATRGGELGWLNPGDTVPEFERVMNTMPDGSVSEPFRTQFGWHILQVTGRREHDDTEQVRRARAADQIRKRKMDEEIQSWLRQLRDEAYVELRLEE
jgi:peptidyl-prolyl cis-trans isomerase SurA